MYTVIAARLHMHLVFQGKLKQQQCMKIMFLYTHCEPKKTPKYFLIYSLQNLTDCNKIWYILS